MAERGRSQQRRDGIQTLPVLGLHREEHTVPTQEAQAIAPAPLLAADAHAELNLSSKNVQVASAHPSRTPRAQNEPVADLSTFGASPICQVNTAELAIQSSQYHDYGKPLTIATNTTDASLNPDATLRDLLSQDKSHVSSTPGPSTAITAPTSNFTSTWDAGMASANDLDINFDMSLGETSSHLPMLGDPSNDEAVVVSPGLLNFLSAIDIEPALVTAPVAAPELQHQALWTR